eukprot:CAMPEP_0170592874 /NCGR_PEP_ID=MMETSP0224-20130122/13151_1 /TAXON_ID=285029 /ORGANISM="Togula jolla, Strain CCCM 725" /LENGTH=41 /DNA_ID= /DNA_START= /DNA_END= /DNA_ORIENTATION=
MTKFLLVDEVPHRGGATLAAAAGNEVVLRHVVHEDVLISAP